MGSPRSDSLSEATSTSLCCLARYKNDFSPLNTALTCDTIPAIFAFHFRWAGRRHGGLMVKRGRAADRAVSFRSCFPSCFKSSLETAPRLALNSELSNAFFFFFFLHVLWIYLTQLYTLTRRYCEGRWGKESATEEEVGLYTR